MCVWVNCGCLLPGVVLQCVAVCYSVLQRYTCAASMLVSMCVVCEMVVCQMMLQSVAVCCSVMQCIVGCLAVCVVACLNILQGVAVCCSVLQCVAVCCSELACKLKIEYKLLYIYTIYKLCIHIINMIIYVCRMVCAGVACIP